ncbi:MAG: succinylglutamate desuccinylase/aspartoacylase family protein [Cyclobacteriaceae bacterium]
MDRVLGFIQGTDNGPLIACVAALHGNEQVGIKAFKRVFDKIQTHKIQVQGSLLGLAGNVKAISTNTRFIDYDLNRSWTDMHLQHAQIQGDFKRAEDEEMIDLKNRLDTYFSKGTRPKVLIDLHATSSANGNFIVIPENDAANPIVKSLQQPIVVNLDQYVNGTMLQHYHTQGVLAFAFEGGMIGTPEALILHEAGLWEILKASGVIQAHDQPAPDHYSEILRKFTIGLPNAVKVVFRHPINLHEDFKMKEGFVNFQQINRGDHLADTIYGPLFSPTDGMIFMPLYQKEGNDGFFIVREVNSNQVLSNN